MAPCELGPTYVKTGSMEAQSTPPNSDPCKSLGDDGRSVSSRDRVKNPIPVGTSSGEYGLGNADAAFEVAGLCARLMIQECQRHETGALSEWLKNARQPSRRRLGPRR